MDCDYSIRYQYPKDCFEDRSLEELVRYSGYETEGKRLIVDFLDSRLLLEHPSARFFSSEGIEVHPDIYTQVAILNYLINKSDVKEKGKLIPYDGLTECYGQIHKKKHIDGFLQWFAWYFLRHPAQLDEAAGMLGASSRADLEQGRVEITVRPFPRIPMTLAGWREDGRELGQVYFDESVREIVDTETCGALTRIVVEHLQRRVKQMDRQDCQG